MSGPATTVATPAGAPDGPPQLAGLPHPAEIVEAVMAAAGGRDCVAVVEDTSSAEVRMACNSFSTNGVRRDRRVTVVCFDPHGGGIATGIAEASGGVDPAALVAAAARDAAAAQPAADAAPLLGGHGGGAMSSEVPETSLDAFGSILAPLGQAFARGGPAGIELAGFAEHQVRTVSLATSRGLRRRYSEPAGSLQLSARSSGGSSSAWVGQGTADFADIDVGEIEDRLRRRLEWGRRRIDLPAGRYETLLPPAAVADLMIALTGALGRTDAEEGRSVFARPGGGTREGEPISRLPFTLWSDPGAPGIACTPFVVATAAGPDTSLFDNGLALKPTRWISQGRLVRLRAHRAAALQSGLPATPFVDNLLLDAGGRATLDDMVGRTERGLLLTCLWYVREVDPASLLLTGLTRDGVYLVHEGEVVGAVNNFRFNESPVDLLGRATEAGCPARCLGREFGEWMTRTSMPAIRVPDFNMSSVSPAV